MGGLEEVVLKRGEAFGKLAHRLAHLHLQKPVLLVIPPEGHSPVKNRKILIKPVALELPILIVRILPPPEKGGLTGRRKGVKAVLKEGYVGNLDPKFAHLVFPRSLVATGPLSESFLPMLQLYQEPIKERVRPLSLGKHLAALTALSWHTGHTIKDLRWPNLGETAYDIYLKASPEEAHPAHNVLETLKDLMKGFKGLWEAGISEAQKQRLEHTFRDHFKRFVENPEALHAYLRKEREKLYRVLRNLGYEVEDEWHILGG